MSPDSLRLMLVDEDPVFRLGLKIWLEQSAGFEVAAEASQGEEALALLAARCRPPTDSEAEADEVESEPAADTLPDLDLVILDLGLGEGMPDQLPGLQLCAAIKSRYPTLPVLVLSSRTEPVLQAAARQMGADAYGARGMPVRELAQLIEQLAGPPSQGIEIQAPAMAAETFTRLVPSPLTALRISLRLSSLQQIEAAIAELSNAQRSGTSSALSEALLAGRYRELRAARWLIKRILATPGFSDQWSPVTAAEPASAAAPPPQRIEPMAEANLPEPGRNLVPTTSDRLSLQRGDLQTVVFESVFRKLQSPLENISGLPLEIDILREEKKRELLFLTLRKLEDALDDLRQARLLPGQLTVTCPDILRDVWQAVITDFFGRYYTLEVGVLEQPVVKTLLLEETTVQTAILNKIPQVPLLLGHLLFQEAMVVDGSAYLATTPEALGRSRLLLENLLIQVANAVMQPLLNRFADIEEIKKYLYQRRIMSTRDIERFRNDLSWRYRWDSLLNEPKAVFESQHRLLMLTERGIQTRFVYAPRQEELDRLSGLQLSVTLAIEARDAIAPRLRTTISFLGSGLVYLLTDVVGRGIGLIGRGILKGVGSAWNDPKYRRKG
ncbi:DUF3685 domain-containing protein [Pseudanabaena sp. FACHB-2040]|uniref:DUF3685 domain-containing protein n=1 Tax=Pseudanabaena sp. FACHB-2040 TaxID=2692859 RepID=UPI00168615E3|nr:DUF3685 domain-containing protein [Pseudanabaena sp. FACHB-2040]MBD2260706.1 DUF3685 domain-containing protein [Pseudanabaena sp. FACHB-2040]